MFKIILLHYSNCRLFGRGERERRPIPPLALSLLVTSSTSVELELEEEEGVEDTLFVKEKEDGGGQEQVVVG